MRWSFDPAELTEAERESLRPLVVDPKAPAGRCRYRSASSCCAAPASSRSCARCAGPGRRPNRARRWSTGSWTGPPFDLEREPLEVLPRWLQAVRWFDGVVPELPSAAAVHRTLERRRVRGQLTAVAGPGFRGRIAELATLDAWFTSPRPRPDGRLGDRRGGQVRAGRPVRRAVAGAGPAVLAGLRPCRSRARRRRLADDRARRPGRRAAGRLHRARGGRHLVGARGVPVRGRAHRRGCRGRPCSCSTGSRSPSTPPAPGDLAGARPCCSTRPRGCACWSAGVPRCRTCSSAAGARTTCDSPGWTRWSRPTGWPSGGSPIPGCGTGWSPPPGGSRWCSSWRCACSKPAAASTSCPR